ncbi:MAG: DHHA1 domain-containing protein [Candidatus Hodarchaeales archaeon]|jgi:hypothetical protein
MYDEVRNFLNSITDKKKSFGFDVIDLCQMEGKKVAFHSTCTDGIISAAVLKSTLEEAIFIPLDYWILKQVPTRNYLSNVKWHAILDLEPFNKDVTELYVDHHMSTINKIILSKKIHFETGLNGVSAANVLLRSIFDKHEVPDILFNIVEISKITDTANFDIKAPVTSIVQNNVKNDFNEQVWYLEDACKSCENVQQNLELVELLSEKGLNGIFQNKVIHRVNYHRKKRKYYQNYGKKLESNDVVILINPPDTVAQDTIIHTLLEKPKTKVTFSLIETQSGTKISMRKSKRFEKSNPGLANKILLNKFAESMEGGGHPAAAGAKSNNLQEAVEKITHWVKKFSFNINIVNIKSELRKFR